MDLLRSSWELLRSKEPEQELRSRELGPVLELRSKVLARSRVLVRSSLTSCS
jgi:hypothetical protein